MTYEENYKINQELHDEAVRVRKYNEQIGLECHKCKIRPHQLGEIMSIYCNECYKELSTFA